MVKKIVLVILFIFIFIPSASAEEISLSVDDAVAVALRDNHDVLLKAEDLKKAKLKISESRSSFLPTLNFVASRTDMRGYYSKDLVETNTQTTLKQYLYKGGKTWNTLQRDEYGLNVKEALLNKAKIETVLNVKKAFCTLLLAINFADLNKVILENTKAHIEVTRERYKKGQASSQDVLSIESSLSSVEEAYQISLNQIESGQALLNNLLYLEKDVRVKPIGEFSYEPKDIVYDQSLLDAIKQRPEIKQYEAQQEADKKSIEIAKADNRPNIYASWDYYTGDHAALGTAKNQNDYNIIGVTFSWPIFDGWATKAKVEQAMVDLKETQLLKEKTTKDIASELKNSYLDLKNAIASIKAGESDIKVYNDNLKSAKEKYTSGIVSETDLSDASLKYEISNFNLKQAVYDYIIAKFSFDKAMGGI